tara:strand:+ start:105 stop:326 length:222 start_codon:yes stop_codon:yes gene_type:complete
MVLKDDTWKFDSVRHELAAYATNESWDKLREDSIDKLISGQKDPNKKQWDKLDDWLKATFKGPVETIINDTEL